MVDFKVFETSRGILHHTVSHIKKNGVRVVNRLNRLLRRELSHVIQWRNYGEKFGCRIPPSLFFLDYTPNGRMYLLIKHYYSLFYRNNFRKLEYSNLDVYNQDKINI